MTEPHQATIDNAMARFIAKASSPERQAEIKKQQEEAELQSQLQKRDELRRVWNAPVRHVKCKPRPEGEWWVQSQKLSSMLEPSVGRIIALVGGRGNGKTQLAIEAMKVKTADMKAALFVTAVEFFIRIKSTYRKDSETDEMEVLRDYQKPKLLVIDEIGKRGSSEWENTMLFELMNRRYNDMNDTILIDNRTKQEFVESIGPSLASRMSEGGGIIECNWPSFRT